MRWHFAEFCLDTDRRELRRRGEAVRIEPQAFDLLEHLIVHRDRLVTRDDLIEGVWGGRIVSESALATCINAARVAVGDSGDRQALIRTIPRKGLRFVGDAREEVGASSAPPPAPVPLPDRPSIAVLPFDNLGADPAQDYFADGIVEGIITGLCRARWLFVIARNSSFAYKGRAVPVTQVGRELGVRYVLGGSIQRAGSRVRIGAQLLDTTTGAHLWAERFDRVLEDVFALQDEVAVAVVGALAPRLEDAEIARARRKPTDSLDAYDLVLRGMAEHRRWTRDAITEALRLYMASTAIDDRFAMAHSLASLCYHERAANGWMADRDSESAEAMRLAARALELGRDDAAILACVASVYAQIAQDIEAASDLIAEALAIDANQAYAWLLRGWVKAWNCASEEAIESFQTMMRLSPLDPHVFRAQAGIGAAHLVARRFEEARLWAERAHRANPVYGPPLRVAAAALAHAGRLEDARRVMAELRANDPGLRIANLRQRAPWRAEAFAVLADGLRLAGLPE
ncbi:winged helix-turn-helix domain-containing protein [Falsiroseomonas sp. HW251]|uniref:winged helix-turn-helix domain-containing protein n=1 Tax=Falsiroseomonas sp. HW251 TaxID=3390998 RepID=UPI003D318AEF